jgi:DNA-binding CsgD family transcriptional regulator
MLLVQYLARQPAMDKVAQFLVLSLFANHEPRSALISVFASDGHVHAAGSFGLAHEAVNGFRRMSVWDSAPAADVIRNGQPLLITDIDDPRTRYPRPVDGDLLAQPTAAWPLVLAGERLGSLQIHFSVPFEKQDVAPIFEGVCPVLALYLHWTRSGNSNGHHVASTRAASNGRSNESSMTSNSLDGKQLTDRQMTILRMIATGMTNPQIAARIGFSDSTVRQETMAIYRFLGANGRREATHIASVRGLLVEEHAFPHVGQLTSLS